MSQAAGHREDHQEDIMANVSEVVPIGVTVKAAGTASAKLVTATFDTTSTSVTVCPDGTIDLSGIKSQVLLVFNLDTAPLTWDNGKTLYPKKFFTDRKDGRDVCYIGDTVSTKKYYSKWRIEFDKFDIDGTLLKLTVLCRNKERSPDGKPREYYYSLAISVPGCTPPMFRPDPRIINGGNG
jgi:hypothetical protein